MGNPIFGADNRLEQDSVSISTPSSASFPSANLHDGRPFTVFKTSSAVASVSITTDSGSSTDVDYFMLVGHDLLSPAGAGGACSISFASSPNGSTWTTIFSVTPADNKIICRAFTKVSTRYFRLTISRGTNFIPSLGELQWGKRVEMPYGIEVGFDPQDQMIEASSQSSQTGNILGAIRTYISRKASIRIPLLLDSFVRGTSVSDFGYFWDNHASKMKPFLFAWNPGNPGSYEKDSFFCVIDPRSGIKRPTKTPLDSGYRDIEFEVIGLQE